MGPASDDDESLSGYDGEFADEPFSFEGGSDDDEGGGPAGPRGKAGDGGAGGKKAAAAHPAEDERSGEEESDDGGDDDDDADDDDVDDDDDGAVVDDNGGAAAAADSGAAAGAGGARPLYVVADEDRITSNIMTVAEATRAIAIRAKQIADHGDDYAETSAEDDSAISRAKKELIQRRAPLVLEREVGVAPGGARGIERWPVRKMGYPPLL